MSIQHIIAELQQCLAELKNPKLSQKRQRQLVSMVHGYLREIVILKARGYWFSKDYSRWAEPSGTTAPYTFLADTAVSWKERQIRKGSAFQRA